MNNNNINERLDTLQYTIMDNVKEFFTLYNEAHPDTQVNILEFDDFIIELRKKE